MSIVLPSFRAADVLSRNVPRLIDYLDGLQIIYEVIVVDDGSGDAGKTADVARALACHFLGLSRNTGKGAAVRTGMLAATGRFRIFTDADVPFEFDAITTMLRYLDLIST